MIELDKIYNEDCLVGMQRIPDGSVDAVICDLPYGTTRNQWDSVIPIEKLWAEYRRIIKERGAIVLFGQQPFASALVMSNPQMFKYEWIWEKSRATGHLNAKKMPMKVHENVLIFYDTLPTYNPQFTKGDPYVGHCDGHSSNYGYQAGAVVVNEGIRYPHDIIEFTSEMDTIHPTQKPVDLLRYLVLTYTNEGDTVLDNCMGSGTTAVACIKEKRHFIGFEKDETYWKKAVQRVKNAQRQMELF